MTIAEIIAALGGNKVAAAACGIGETAVSMWRRNGIPSKHWPAIVRATASGETPITYENLEQAGPESRAA